MASSEKWVMDLVMELQREENDHPKLFRQVSGGEYVQYPWCPFVALNLVPDEVKNAAAAIAAYRVEADRDKSPSEES